MKKKLVLFFALMLMCVSTVFASEFNDIENHWAQSSIERMANEEIVNGDGNGAYRPEEYITRAELVTMIVRIFEPSKSADLSEYSDVDVNAWYYDALAKGVEMGIIKGYGNGKLKPNAYVSRQEAIVMLDRIYKLSNSGDNEETSLNDFNDSDEVDDWAKDAMLAFILNDYIKGYTDNTIKPTTLIKRAEVVTLLDRSIAKIIKESDEYDLSDVESGIVVIKAEDVELKNADGKNIFVLNEEIKKSLDTDSKDDVTIVVISSDDEKEDEDKKDDDKKPSSGVSGSIISTADITVTSSGDIYVISKRGTVKAGAKLTVKVDDVIVVDNYTVTADETLKTEMVKIINVLEVAKVVKTVSDGYNTNADFRELGFNMVLDMNDAQQQVAFATMITGDENKALIENVYDEMITSELLTGENQITDEYIKELAIENLTETFTYEEAINLLNQI